MRKETRKSRQEEKKRKRKKRKERRKEEIKFINRRRSGAPLNGGRKGKEPMKCTCTRLNEEGKFEEGTPRGKGRSQKRKTKEQQPKDWRKEEEREAERESRKRKDKKEQKIRKLAKINMSSHEELDTHHKCLRTTNSQRPVRARASQPVPRV